MDNLFFLEVKCKKTHSTFYARFDLAADDKWVLTYGEKNLPRTSGSSSGKNVNHDLSNCRVGPQYGCPYCGNTGFVKCSRCGKYTCYSEGRFTCEHCGHSGDVNGTIDEVSSTHGGRGQ